MAHTQQHWPNWVDALGQSYKVGDTVAVAVGGNSPEQVIGIVKSINKTTKDGLNITAGAGKSLQPSCSVTITVTTRGGRYSNHVGLTRIQTYQHPNRIVKLRSGEIPADELRFAVEDVLRLEQSLRNDTQKLSGS